MINKNNTNRSTGPKPRATHSPSKRPTTTAAPQFNAEPPFRRSLSVKKPTVSHKPRVGSSAGPHKPRNSSAALPHKPRVSHKPRTTSPAGRGLNARDRQKALRKDMPRIARKQPDDIIPPIGDSVRIIPLGGVEEVGKNMILVEYKDDIIIFDMGFQFVSEEETPGIDYILPNTKYLEERKDKIRGLVVTHGHLDHIGGIPFIIDRIGNPKIYTRSLTKMMIEKRQTEFPHLPKLDIKVVGPDDNLKLGNLPIKFHPISHSIPDAMAVSVETPLGNIVVTGDLKVDHIDEDPTDQEKKVWGDIGKNNNLLLISDSTNAENPGFSITEKKIQQNIEEII